MNQITIKEALKDLNYDTPIGINENEPIIPTLYDEQIYENSLVFCTEKYNETDRKTPLRFNDKKPYAAVVSYNHEVPDSKIPIIRVASVRTALAHTISNLYNINYSKMKIIGITGTNGKTTTSTIIFEILKKIGYSVGFIGTGKIYINDELITDYTYSMTTPDPTLLYKALADMYKAKCEYVVMEVSSHSLALGKVSPIKFEYCIFTNLSNEHIDFHGSTEEYYKAKVSLFTQTKRGLFNIDDAYCQRAYQEATCEKSSIGIIKEADAFATDIKSNMQEGISFYFRTNNIIFKVNSSLLGAFNVYNIMCALKCLIDLGVPACIAKKALSEIKQIEGRMECYKSDIVAVVDYAHTPNAFYNCLKTLKNLDNKKQNITVVFGCGGNRDKNKRCEMGTIATLYADKIILTEDNNRNESFEDIISDISKGIHFKEYRVIRDRETAIRTAISDASSGDIIAIIGKGHEKYKITNTTIIPYDEIIIVKDALEKRNLSLCE